MLHSSETEKIYLPSTWRKYWEISTSDGKESRIMEQKNVVGTTLKIWSMASSEYYNHENSGLSTYAY